MGLIGYSILKDGLPMKALDRRAVLESVPIWLFVVFERKPDSFGRFTSEQ